VSEEKQQATVEGRWARRAVWTRKPAFWMSVALVCVSSLVILGWKLPHLLWLMNSIDATSVPIGPLQAVAPPAGAERCHVGSVSILLTPEWRRDVRAIDVLGGGLEFRSGQRTVFVGLAQNNEATYQAHQALAANLSEQSPMRLRAAAYRACNNDFRLSMSWQEFEDFQRLLSYKLLACSRSAVGVEELYRDDLEGLLIVYNRHASFEWVSADGQAAGSLFFGDRSAQIDLEWMRTICASIQFSGQTSSDRPTQDELDRILQQVKR